MVTTMKSTEQLMELGSALKGFTLHDVTPVLGPDTPMFLVHPLPQVEPTCRYEPEAAYSASNRLIMSEHSGAHVDAPSHFDRNGASMDQVPIDRLFLQPFKKFDFTSLDPQPGQLLGVEELHAAADRGGFELRAGDIAVLEYGWDQYRPGGSAGKEAGWWGNNEPGLTPEACAYFADTGVIAVASDTPGAECATKDGEILTTPGHDTYFLPRGILIIESLQGLGEVPSTGLFAALPLKIEGGTASPLRVLLLTA